LARRPPSSSPRAGAKVAVLDLNADAADALAERISGRVLAIDIADAEAAATTVATIAASGSGGSTPTTCKPARANGCYGCTTLPDLNFC